MRVIAILPVAVAIASATTWADEPDVSPARDLDVSDVVALLRAAESQGEWPPGLIVRLDAEMWGSNRKAEGKESRVREMWEFSDQQVHRLALEKVPGERGKSVYRRVQSLPLAAQKLVPALLHADIEAIVEGDGEGEGLMFAGTDFTFGHRYVELLVDGDSVVRLGECCAFAGMAESDALAFAAMYEALATPAREAFSATQ